MKRVLILALVCVNVALLAVLLLGLTTERAEAQVVGGGTNYVVVTANYDSDSDAIWILDLRTRKLAALRFDRNVGNGRMVAYENQINLLQDFGRQPIP